jgi:hypothetical protein
MYLLLAPQGMCLCLGIWIGDGVVLPVTVKSCISHMWQRKRFCPIQCLSFHLLVILQQLPFTTHTHTHTHTFPLTPVRCLPKAPALKRTPIPSIISSATAPIQALHLTLTLPFYSAALPPSNLCIQQPPSTKPISACITARIGPFDMKNLSFQTSPVFFSLQ